MLISTWNSRTLHHICCMWSGGHMAKMVIDGHMAIGPICDKYGQVGRCLDCILSLLMLQEHHCNSLQVYKEDECRYQSLNSIELCFREKLILGSLWFFKVKTWPSIWEGQRPYTLFRGRIIFSTLWNLCSEKSSGAHVTTWRTGEIVGGRTNFGTKPGLGRQICSLM